ncbi:MAG: ABC transporter permease [Gammaproteobacteria bacterium]|jgi:ABC-2 type transport system permease protein|nr:ABC transporter permease [Gammaproteobacteria bacterium]HUV22168.1 ABC transporter permease subunit [Gammaproteobacteria bacterium]
MIWIIARREFGAMFLAPLAWVILAVIQIILGYMFLTNLDNFFLLQPQLLQLQNTPGVTDIVIAPLMQVAAIILLMVMPLLTMRSIAEEKRNRSLTLLISAPLGMTEIVLGKFFGLMLFVLVLVSMLMLMPLSLYLGTTPDGGKLLSIFLGMLLLLGAFSAIGLYLSSLTENQTIAAVGSFGILLMLWIIDWLSESVSSGQSLLAYLSLLQHHESLLEGVFDSSDIAYYLLLITAFLGLTIRQLDRERLL